MLSLFPVLIMVLLKCKPISRLLKLSLFLSLIETWIGLLLRYCWSPIIQLIGRLGDGSVKLLLLKFLNLFQKIHTRISQTFEDSCKTKRMMHLWFIFLLFHKTSQMHFVTGSNQNYERKNINVMKYCYDMVWQKVNM